MSARIFAHALLVALAGAAVSGCGGGGGSSSPESQTAAAIVSLDKAALAGSVTEAEFATRLDGILAGVDERTDGIQQLALYYEDEVVGSGLLAGTAPGGIAAAKTAQQTIDDIKGSQAYQMLEAFVTSVASNLLIPDPVNTLLAFADKDVFLSTASVTIRARIYDALVNGQITPEQAEVLYELGRQNPWKAQRALMTLLNQTPPPHLDTLAAAPCLRGCAPSGDTTVYTGPFSKVFSSSNGGCTWQESLSGTIEVVVSGAGTVADPFTGTMDVTGSLVETLIAGANCDPGGTYTITSFDGTVLGNDGKLYGEGDGIMGAGTFYAALDGATVTSTQVTGPFQLQVSTESVQMAVTLGN